MHLEFPKPSEWSDLENLTAMLVRYQNGAKNVQRNGRLGQKQNGVDVVARMWGPTGEYHAGYQCKHVQTLSMQDIEDECTKAKGFKPSLEHFVIVTTLTCDVHLQSSVRNIPETRHGFPVDIWFWDELNENLNRSADAAQAYFSEITLAAQPAAAITHAEVLRRALIRPAFTDSIHQERDVDDLVEALAATKGFMRTGYLYDNSRHLVESTYPSWRIGEKRYRAFCDAFTKDLDNLYDFVQSKKDDLRDTSTNRGASAAIRFSSQRANLIERANVVFKRLALDELPVRP